MRTNKQVNDEMSRLLLMKPKVRNRSAFGDDHHMAIDAQLIVLRDQMSEDDIYNTWIGNDEMYLLENALEARKWLDGEGDKPSKDWKDLVLK